MILLIIFFSIPALIPLLLPGFFEPHDLHHFADIYQMAQSIVATGFPPRIGPDFLYGFSYPLFNFYYVLPFYLGAFVYFLTGSVIAGFKFVFLFIALLGSIGMYLFSRKYVSKISSLVASILFLYTPYRAVQFYVRGAMGEALALSLSTFVAFSLVSLVRKPNNKNLFFFSITLSFFILSHNYLFLLFAPFFVLLFLFEVFNVKKVDLQKVFKKTTLGAFFSILITSYWWMPAFLEYKLVSSQTPFNYIDHFPFIKQLIIPSWGYGSSHWGPYDEISFQIGVVNLIIVSLFLVVLFTKLFNSKNTIKPIYFWAIGSFLVSIFMMNIRSNFLWKILPFTNFIQFPWRFLIFTTFFSSLIAGFFIDELIKKKILKYIFSFVLILFIIIFNFKYFRPSKIVFNSNKYYLNRFFALDNYVSNEYKNYSEDYLLLPVNVIQKPNYLPQTKFVFNSDKVVYLDENKLSKTHWKVNVTLSGRSDVYVNVLFFPGWEVLVNKTTKEFDVTDEGLIKFELEEGEYQIELVWKETNLRKFADLLSVLGIMLITYYFLKNER